MAETMRALVKTAKGAGHVGLREVPVPETERDEILMEVKFAGICGSDLHIETGVHDHYPPVIMGHEYSGVVGRLGSDVTGLQVGQPICYHHGPSPFPGYRRDGCFARYLKLKADTVMPLPEGISLEEATQFETVRPAIAVVRDGARMKPGEHLVISGPGPVGLLALQVAKADGAGKVTVIGAERDAKLRLPTAKELGADEVLQFEEGLAEQFAGENAPHNWCECSGAPGALKLAVDCVRYGGRVVESGISAGPWDVDFRRLARCNLTIRGMWGGSEDYVFTGIDMIRAGTLSITRIITHVMPLAEWEEAFRMLRGGEAIKILLVP